MAHQCDIVAVQPVTLAVTDAQTKQAEIPSRIPSMFDIVYGWLPGSGVQQAGLNYVVYDQFGPNGMRMRVGFPVSKTFADTAQVKCLRLAGGRAAHTTVVGPYSGISAAHMDLNAWCARHDACARRTRRGRSTETGSKTSRNWSPTSTSGWRERRDSARRSHRSAVTGVRAARNSRDPRHPAR